MIDFAKINVLAVDVDGTLTDGLYNVSSDGTITKGFHTRDFSAMDRLAKAGFIVLIITGANDGVIERKLATSKATGLILQANSKNKHAEISEWLAKEGKGGWERIAFIGDAENDLKAMEHAAWSSCPSDAIPEVIDNSHYVSEFPGGRGAVYDCVRKLCEKKGLKW